MSRSIAELSKPKDAVIADFCEALHNYVIHIDKHGRYPSLTSEDLSVGWTERTFQLKPHDVYYAFQIGYVSGHAVPCESEEEDFLTYMVSPKFLKDLIDYPTNVGRQVLFNAGRHARHSPFAYGQRRVAWRDLKESMLEAMTDWMIKAIER